MGNIPTPYFYNPADRWNVFDHLYYKIKGFILRRTYFPDINPKYWVKKV